jgi:5'-AMP-activated protein kinase catalytic alpha subunit
MNIKIVDFGLSNIYKPNQLLKTACGSPCYAAPEMIAGKKYAGLMVDLWSCGVILYALLCGYLPFEDPNTTLLYKKIIAGEYTTPKFLSSNSIALLKGILQTDPVKRFTIPDIRSTSWFALHDYEETKGIIVGSDAIRANEYVVE